MKKFDVFLSHSSADKAAVESLADRLEVQGLKPFLDRWHLVPGDTWQEALEEALGESQTCAIFLGPQGLGSWQHEEMRVAIEERVRDRTVRVIPVLLPGAADPVGQQLPRFLRRSGWVDFRGGLDDADAFRRLCAGIRGQAPGPGGGGFVVPRGPSAISLPDFGALLARWKEMAGVVAAIGAGLYPLGFLAERSREALLGLTDPLTYPKEQVFETGWRALSEVPGAMLRSLRPGHPGVLWSSASLLVLCLAFGFALFHAPFFKHRPLRTGLFGLAFFSLLLGFFAYRTVLRPTLPPDSQGPEYVVSPSDPARFEVVSWLRNDDDRNGRRRHGLYGLWGWGMLAVGMAFLKALSLQDLREKRLLLSGFAFLGVLLASQLPSAYVVGRIGLLYPRVHLTDACDDAPLRAAVAAGTCCAFDVSHGATSKMIHFRGDGCPGGRASFESFPGDQSACISSAGQPKVVFIPCG